MWPGAQSWRKSVHTDGEFSTFSCIMQRDTLQGCMHQFSNELLIFPNLGVTSVRGSDFATSWRLSPKRVGP